MISFIGIDPGLTGAACLLDENLRNSGAYTPIFYDFNGAAGAAEFLRGWTRRRDILGALIEDVGARPRDGRVSLFKFGHNAGIWEGILAALLIPYTKMRPQEWQRGQIPPDIIGRFKSTKHRSVAAARRLFPGETGIGGALLLKKHHNRADAALMADKIRHFITRGLPVKWEGRGGGRR